MTRWLTLTPDGVLTEQTDEPTLEALQGAVGGGSIEALASPDPDLSVSIFVNEEKVDANRDPLPVNDRATAWMRPILWPGSKINGTLVLAGAVNGEELGDLTDEQIAKAKEIFSGA